MTSEAATAPLAGIRVGVTASRKVEEQAGLLRRRGAAVETAPVLAEDASTVDTDGLRRDTEALLQTPVDLLLATTGVGVTAWFDHAAAWGLADRLRAHLAGAEILARSPKAVGALRRCGLREQWSSATERLSDVLAQLAGRDLRGQHVVLQEHGQDLSSVAATLRGEGARVTPVVTYRVRAADDPGPARRMAGQVADREVDAVTFTAAPAVDALMAAATALGREDEVVAAFGADVLAVCVGPVTAEAFAPWGVPAVHPERSRLAAMVELLEQQLGR